MVEDFGQLDTLDAGGYVTRDEIEADDEEEGEQVVQIVHGADLFIPIPKLIVSRLQNPT